MTATEYKVITKDTPTELWASGFYGEAGREKAERLIEERYWHRLMHAENRHKTLVVVPS